MMPNLSHSRQALHIRAVANEAPRIVPQEIVDENAEILVVPENQYAPGEGAPTESREYEVRFGQIYLSKPTITEADGETSILFPKESRLRNLT